MASEVLAVPEEHLEAVIGVIETGLHHYRSAPREVRFQLQKWCREERDYLSRLHDDGGPNGG